MVDAEQKILPHKYFMAKKSVTALQGLKRIISTTMIYIMKFGACLQTWPVTTLADLLRADKQMKEMCSCVPLGTKSRAVRRLIWVMVETSFHMSPCRGRSLKTKHLSLNRKNVPLGETWEPQNLFLLLYSKKHILLGQRCNFDSVAWPCKSAAVS